MKIDSLLARMSFLRYYLLKLNILARLIAILIYVYDAVYRTYRNRKLSATIYLDETHPQTDKSIDNV